MDNTNLYVCSISMSYNAADPADAAKQLIDNIRTNPNWYVKVQEITPNGTLFPSHVIVDTETGEIEEGQ